MNRVTHAYDGPLALFLIGLRVHKPWRPSVVRAAASAMPAMIAELEANKAAAEHGEAWLGRVNLYGDDSGELHKWEGGEVYNFGADFVLPCYDAEVERLVRERAEAPYTGTADDGKRVDAIFARIGEVGGSHLFWS